MIKKIVKLVLKAIERAKYSIAQAKFYYFASARPPIPDRIIIDTVNACNLRCPLCPTGIDRLKYDKSVMSIDTFKTIIKKMPNLKHIDLYDWGEPFINPDIFKFIKHAKDNNVKCCINSNFSFDRDESFFTAIAESGLDYLTLSIDGASRESYSKYRIGGDFNLVISNIKRLIEAKKKIDSPHPVIAWKFIVNRFNEGEIDLAKTMAGDLGIKFLIDRMGLGDDVPDMEFDNTIEERKEYWLPKSNEFVYDHYVGKYKRPLHDKPCKQLFTTLVINPDGKISPCCMTTDKSNVFGDLLTDSVYEIWNNRKYSYARSLFLHKRHRGPAEQIICSRCHNYKKKRTGKGQAHTQSGECA